MNDYNDYEDDYDYGEYVEDKEQSFADTLENTLNVLTENVQKYVVNLGGVYVPDTVLDDMLPENCDANLVAKAVLKNAFKVVSTNMPEVDGLYEDIIPQEIADLLRSNPFCDWISLLGNHLSSYAQTYYGE